jgi:Pyruvate/2-oxoacid:ferredoxin oxidoreductase delta subunit
MGAIKDIVDLAKDLESRAKERHDMGIIHKIQALAFSFQSSYTDTVERDVRLLQENADLRKQLEAAQSEEIRFHSALEFRRSKRTGDQWMPFCPKCHIPALVDHSQNDYVVCTGCEWCSLVLVTKVPHIISQL